MNNPLKSIFISGDASSNDIQYKLCADYFQLQYGTWETAISDVCFTCLKPVEKDSIFNLSTNLVQGHSLSHSKRLCKDNIILATIHFKKDKEKSVFNAPVLKWFVINNIPNDYLKIDVKQWPQKVVSMPNTVLLSVSLLFRRIV